MDALPADRREKIEARTTALAQAVVVTDGYVLMPREATRAMTMAACDYLPSCEHIFGHAGELLRKCYAKMVDVAAQPPAERKLPELILEYARDLRRNSSGGDDYPWEYAKSTADYLEELVRRSGVEINMNHAILSENAGQVFPDLGPDWTPNNPHIAAMFSKNPHNHSSAATEDADLLGEMKHGHAEPVANRHYAWAVAEITQLRQKVSKSIDEASFADLRASGGIEPRALLETQAAQVPSEPQRSGNDDLRDLAERLFTDAHRDDVPQVVRFRLKQASEVVRERSAATSGLGKSDMLELSKRIENGLKDDNGDFFAPPLSRKQWWMIASSLDYAARFNTLNEPQRDVAKWPDTLRFDDRDKYIDELEAQIERNRAAPAVSDKDLLNWIENEASRGLTEGDAREALTAIKWKIKDGR